MGRELQWKRRKDASIAAREGTTEYRILVLAPQGCRLFDWYVLLKDGKKVYRTYTKAACKRIANLLASGKKSVFSKVYATLTKKSLKRKFDQHFREFLELTEIPKVPGKHDAFFKAQAAKGIRPNHVVMFNESIKSGKIDRAELTDDYLDSLTVELWPLYHVKEKRPTLPPPPVIVKEKKKTPPPFAQNRLQSPSAINLTYHGDLPEERDIAKRRRISVVTQETKLPFRPENAKFQSLLKWGEKVRDYWEVRNRFATVEYLEYALKHSCGYDFDRSQKAVDKLRAIYRSESDLHDRWMKAMLDRTEKKPDPEKPKKKEVKVKKEKGTKDKWGYRVGSEASKINEVITKVPKSAKQIRKEADVLRDVIPHLRALCKAKLAKKVEGDKYRLFRKKK